MMVRQVLLYPIFKTYTSTGTSNLIHYIQNRSLRTKYSNIMCVDFQIAKILLKCKFCQSSQQTSSFILHKNHEMWKK